MVSAPSHKEGVQERLRSSALARADALAGFMLQNDNLPLLLRYSSPQRVGILHQGRICTRAVTESHLPRRAGTEVRAPLRVQLTMRDSKGFIAELRWRSASKTSSRHVAMRGERGPPEFYTRVLAVVRGAMVRPALCRPRARSPVTRCALPVVLPSSPPPVCGPCDQARPAALCWKRFGLPGPGPLPPQCRQLCEG